MKKLILLLLLATVSAFAQTSSPLPEAPAPKHEALKFSALAAYFAASSEAMNYAVHDGARLCQAEDNRFGVGNRFGTADNFGRRPSTERVLIPGAAILTTATVLEVTHHHKLAKWLLFIGGTTQIGSAVATQWAGCN